MYRREKKSPQPFGSSPQTTNSLSTLERNLTFFSPCIIGLWLLLPRFTKNSRSKVSVLPEIPIVHVVFFIVACICRSSVCLELISLSFNENQRSILLLFANNAAETGRPCNNVDRQDRRESGGIWLTCCFCMTFSKQPAFVLTARFWGWFHQFRSSCGDFFRLTHRKFRRGSQLLDFDFWSVEQKVNLVWRKHQSRPHEAKDFLRKNENWFWRNNEIHPSDIACGLRPFGKWCQFRCRRETDRRRGLWVQGKPSNLMKKSAKSMKLKVSHRFRGMMRRQVSTAC